MVKVIYTLAVNGKGRYACVGGDETRYEYKDVPDEATFQQIKKEIIEELKDKNTPLIKASFYTETNVPFEISYDDINPNDEYNQIEAVNSMTLEKIEADKESFPRDQWELFNMNMELEDVPDSAEEFGKLYEQRMKEGKTLLK